MGKDGTELALRFSYITNSLRYCGPAEATKQFLQYIATKNNADEIRKSVNRFEGLQPYLFAIGSKHGKDMLDYDVVEAYWIGNSLLDEFTTDDLKKIIDRLSERGLPKSIATDLKAKMPSGLVPHHNFNVMYVGVGRTAGTVPTNIQNMDNCRTSWGKVVEIIGDKLIVDTQVLQHDKDKGFFLKDNETKTALFLPQMLPTVKKGDVVALHWGFACLILDERQVENLKKYTLKVIEAM